MSNLLIITGGIFWLLTYIEIIRKGFKDKTFGMPIPVLLINICWEFINSFVYPADNEQLYINYLWLLLDFVILYQCLKYWKNDFKDISPKIFYPAFAACLVLTYFFLIAVAKEFGLLLGSFYSAFGDNLLMSILFIAMFYRRGSLRGQSVLIALFKMLGTVAIFAAYYDFSKEIQNSILLKFFYVSIFLFDLAYLILVYLQSKKSLLFPAKELA